MPYTLKPDQENFIKEFVKGRLKSADIAHGFDHVEYVVKMAYQIGKKEGANFRILIPAAYLHDLVSRDEVESFDLHTEKSANLGKSFLKTLGFHENEVNQIGDTISTSSYQSYLKGKSPTTLEGKILRDADWLDAIGARGIARIFTFAGHYGCKEIGKIPWNPENPEKFDMNTSGPDPSPIYHFCSKLLWLKDLMLTETGKIEAQKRHDFMVYFLKKYKEECIP